jgi:hypothetical protein
LKNFIILNRTFKNVAASLSGIVAAIVVVSIIAHGFITSQLTGISTVFLSTLHSSKFFIPEGGELYPINFLNYINSNILLFSVFAIVVCFEIVEYVHFRRNSYTNESNDSVVVDPRWPLKMTTFFISILFFYGTIKISARFNDYFIFFVGFYIVIALSTLLSTIRFSTKRAYYSVATGLGIIVITFFANNILQIQNLVASSGSPVEVFAGIGNWLNTNTKKGDIIFNPNWSWFPQLYYYSPDRYYIAGMEPRVFYDENQKLYWEWLNIGYRGFSCDKEFCFDLETKREMMLRSSTTASVWYKTAGDEIAHTMLTDFKSSYIIGSEAETSRLNEVLDHNKHFKKMYGAGKAYSIYKVLP